MGVDILHWLLLIVVMLGVYLMYYLVGILFDTEIFNAITLQDNGFSVSFIGVILLVVTSVLVTKFIPNIKKKLVIFNK